MAPECLRRSSIQWVCYKRWVEERDFAFGFDGFKVGDSSQGKMKMSASDLMFHIIFTSLRSKLFVTSIKIVL